MNENVQPASATPAEGESASKRAGVSRRTIVKGAAWSVPVISVVAAVPFASASGTLRIALTIPPVGCTSVGAALPDAVASVTDDSGTVTDATVTFTFVSADGGEVSIGGVTYPTPSPTLTLPRGVSTLTGVTAAAPGTVTVVASATTPDGRTASQAQTYTVCIPSEINWGRNSAGELGRDLLNPPVPGNWDPITGAVLPAGVSVVSVGRGGFVGYIIASDGNVYSTGSADSFGLGRPGPGSNTPTAIPELAGKGIVDVQSWTGSGNGVWSMTGPSFALSSDGTVYSWGPAAYNGRGDGESSTTPKPIPGLTNVKQIAATESNGYALKDDGTVWVWGVNAFGRLGKDFGSDQAVPVQLIDAGTANAQLTSTYRAGFVRKTDGTVASWGSGTNGVLGTGTFSDSYYTVLPGLSGVASLRASAYSVFAILGDGTVRAWGDNWNGALSIGNSGGTKYDSPQVVVRRNDAERLYDGTDTPSGGWVDLTGVHDVAPIFYSTQFVLANDEVWTTGDGNYGQWGWNPSGKPYSPDKDIYGAAYNPNLSGRGISKGGAIWGLTDGFYAKTVNDTKGSEHY